MQKFRIPVWYLISGHRFQSVFTTKATSLEAAISNAEASPDVLWVIKG